MRKAMRVLTVTWLTAAVASSAIEAQPATRQSSTVAVIGTDYAFTGLPAELPAGQAIFSFENRGTVRHEMSIVRLQEGVSAEQVLRGQSPSSRAIAQSLIGLLIARPGEMGGGRLLVDLKAGEHYLVACSLKDTPTSQPHTQMGMIGTFVVK